MTKYFLIQHILAPGPSFLSFSFHYLCYKRRTAILKPGTPRIVEWKRGMGNQTLFQPNNKDKNTSVFLCTLTIIFNCNCHTLTDRLYSAFTQHASISNLAIKNSGGLYTSVVHQCFLLTLCISIRHIFTYIRDWRLKIP